MSNEKIELPLLKGSNREKCIPASIIVGSIVLLLVLLVAFFSLTFKGTYTLHYSENSNLDYKVYLKENDFYTEKFLEKDKQYISTLVDYVDATFDYSFTSNEKIGMEYTYYVTATVLVNNSNGKNIYKKEQTIVDKKKFSELSNNRFTVKENVKINYDEYNDFAKAFLREYNLSADVELVVSLYVDVDGKHAEFDKKISDKEVISLRIPLTSRTVDIEMDYELSNSVDEVLQYRSTVVNNPVLFTLAIVLIIVDLLVIIGIIIWVIKTRDSQTIYIKRLEKIQKEYSRYLCETVITERVEDMMKTRSLRIELIKTFEGLIDVRDNLGKPILFHEERPGEEAVFYIITDQVGYIYVMRADDFKKKKRK